MDVDQVVLLGRLMLQEVIILAGPILAVAIVVSLVVNIVQVLTSLQDTTISTVARLLATGGALFISMPWMWRHLATFTADNVLRFSRVPEMIEIPLMTIISGLLTIGVRLSGTHAVCAVLRQRGDSGADQGSLRSRADAAALSLWSASRSPAHR